MLLGRILVREKLALNTRRNFMRSEESDAFAVKELSHKGVAENL